MGFSDQIKVPGSVRIPGNIPPSVDQTEIAFCDGLTENVQAAITAERARVQSVLLGGTGATTAGGALTNLGAAAASDLAAEATLARNASNLSSGTVADARLPSASNTAAQAAQDALIAAAGTAIAQHIQFAVATNPVSVNAIVVAPLTAITAVDGAMVLFKAAATGTSAMTLAVSSMGALALVKKNPAGISQALTGPEIVLGGYYLAVYAAATTSWRLVNPTLQAVDIPSTLGATTFSGAITLSGGGVFSGSNSSVSCRYLGGFTGTPGQYGSEFAGYGSGHASYPGSHQSFACLQTRAASTAIGICPVATGDTAEVKIMETQYAGAKVFVDAAGTVTLYSPVYGTVNAAWVNSASPGAAEIGCYISAGVLYFKYGSGGTGKMASFSQIGKA